MVGKVPVPLKEKVPVLLKEKVVIERDVPVVPPKPALTAGSLYATRSSPASTITVLTIRSFRSKSFLLSPNSYDI